MFMHAAINKRSDRLSGLKENVIIGTLISDASFRLKNCHTGTVAATGERKQSVICVWSSTGRAV